MNPSPLRPVPFRQPAAPQATPPSKFADATWELMKVIRLFGVDEQGPDESGRVARGHGATKAWLSLHADRMADALLDHMARRLLPPGQGFEPPPETSSVETKLLSPAQVCGLLQISRSTLLRWERDRWLPSAMRFGVIPRWSRAELVAWFRNREWQR